MQKRLVLFIATAIVAITFTACEKEGQPQSNAGIRPSIDYSTLNASSNYLETFKDSAGNSTVDFSGQTTRQDMLAEMDSVMRLGTKGIAVDANVLTAMFSNQGSPFRNANLNAATDKTLMSKTAASFSAGEADNERQKFISWFDIIATSSLSNSPAAKGTAGIATAINGTSKYLVDEKGIEYGQLVQKGLIGAVMLDQISNVYLGTEKMAADNQTIVNGKNYTQLEHHWDEAYGYMTKNGTFPLRENGVAKERYLGGYLRQVADSSNIFVAFLKGRAAVVNADNATRDEQIAFIRAAAEKAIAQVAVSYLNKTSNNMAADPAAAMHSFAEGLGFIYSLRYAHDAKVSAAQSDEYLASLMGADGFYSLTPTILNDVKADIANYFGFSETFETGH